MLNLSKIEEVYNEAKEPQIRSILVKLKETNPEITARSPFAQLAWISSNTYMLECLYVQNFVDRKRFLHEFDLRESEMFFEVDDELVTKEHAGKTFWRFRYHFYTHELERAYPTKRFASEVVRGDLPDDDLIYFQFLGL